MSEASGINNARALLRDFLRSDWKSCHLTTDDLEVFFSRDPAIRAPHATSSLAQTATVEAQVIATLTAPHLGTLVDLVPPGVVLAPGDRYGRIAVLDAERALIAEAGGTVMQHRFAAGDLVEFGQAIVTLA
jgi:biotin carboxyl carrier protein